MTEHKFNTVKRAKAETLLFRAWDSSMNRGGHVIYLSIAMLAMFASTVISARAETITIGKGTGIVWEGLPFNVTMYGSMGDSDLLNIQGLLAISTANNACLVGGFLAPLTNIAGYQALKIGTGVGLIPRASGYAVYSVANGEQEGLTGTIGIPVSAGQVRTVRGTRSIKNPINTPLGGVSWCLPPKMDDTKNFYLKDSSRTASLFGTWVIVADGTQTNQQITLQPMYAASFSTPATSVYRQIFPSDLTLRVSTLSCSVETTTAIDFGSVQSNTQSGAELASLSNPLTVSCSQSASSEINANINVQFRAISGLYGGAVGRLSLNQNGGYITGEINGGATTSGSCNGNGGIPFDNTQLKVGNITTTETTKTTSNQITWRLCSGGVSLPSGPVSASADMLVTFN